MVYASIHLTADTIGGFPLRMFYLARRIGSVGAIGFFLFGATGCATTRDPTVRVMDAKIVNASAEGLQLEIGLEVVNHGDESIRLDEFEYRVSVGGTSVDQAVWSAEATLASFDARQMAIPAVVRFDQMGWSAAHQPEHLQVTVNGTLSYIAPGELARVFRDMGIPNPRAAINGNSEVTQKGTGH